MTRKLKPVEVILDLDDELRDAILTTGVRLPDGSFRTVEELVAVADLALSQANEVLLKNSLTRRAALVEMKRRGKRGYPVFVASSGGIVSLQVRYVPLVEAVERPKNPRKRSGLPTLEGLREEARVRSINIEDLGRQKHLILARLRGLENAGVASSKNPI